MIKSIRHATSNEHGVEELAIERELSTLEYLTAAAKARSFKIPNTKEEVYVSRGLCWVDKKTGDIPDHEKQIELFYAKASVKRQSELMDFGLKHEQVYGNKRKS